MCQLQPVILKHREQCPVTTCIHKGKITLPHVSVSAYTHCSTNTVQPQNLCILNVQDLNVL
jgi:hypothetical protein